MWIRLKDIKISAEALDTSSEEKLLLDVIVRKFKIDRKAICELVIFRKSPDLRERGRPFFVYTIDLKTNSKLNEVINNKNISIECIQKIENVYNFHLKNLRELRLNKSIGARPVVVGFGPAGIFASLILTELGFAPIVLERGESVDERAFSIESFKKECKLNTESNIQFGEGGAGTFSDGKLNSLIKDKDTIGRFVLEAFVKFGAPQEILYKNKPHIGTDILRKVIKNMREYMITKGAEIHFNTKMTGIVKNEKNEITAIRVINNNSHLRCGNIEKQRALVLKEQTFETDTIFLAIGHSARDTFEYLRDQNVCMEKKPFSLGVRIEHLQSMIDLSQYSTRSDLMRKLNGAADYKLSHRASNGRGVYTFCMCPGGYVVNAASEENRLVTNGMSNYSRAGKNANSALLVGVSPEDFPGEDVLSGVELQRRIEEKAFIAGGRNWKAPCQLVGDFMKNTNSKQLGKVEPTFSNGFSLSDINNVLPLEICEALKEGIAAFGKRIKGFDDYDAVLTGCETRSSSPVRIIRDENGESKGLKGLYPIGEGAGYAGGILSAATDGIKGIEKWLCKM